MTDPTLHVLAPTSVHGPELIARAPENKPDDLIVDLRRFPAAAYRVQRAAVAEDVSEEMIPQADYWQVAADWLKELTEAARLQDSLSVNGYGFWWTLTAQRFVPALEGFGNVFSWVDVLNNISSLQPYSQVVLHGRHEALETVLAQVFGSSRITFQAQSTAAPSSGRSRRSPALLVARALIAVLYFVYAALSRPKICLMSQTNLLRHVGTGRESQLRDIYLGSIGDLLRQHGWRVAVVEKYGVNASWKGLAARGFFFPSDLIILISDPVTRRFGLFRKQVKEWQERWRRTEPLLRDALRYNGADLSPFLLPWLKSQFEVEGPSIEIMTKLWSRVWRLWSPKAIVINNSYGRGQCGAIIAAKRCGIPTVEIQHGVIGRNHFAYFVPQDLATRVGFPLCDTFAVWGPHFQELFGDAGLYDTGQIPVCGSPHVDRLADQLPLRSVTLDALKVPHESDIVLFTSNEFSHGSIEKLLEGIRASGEDPAVHWVIKLHPREQTHKLWEEQIARLKLVNVVVVGGDFDFQALLEACSIHVSFSSTTLIEAAVLGKPNIGLQLARMIDPAGYADAGAFLPAAPEEVAAAVKAMLRDESLREQRLMAQKRFVDAWCLHDGRAVDRIVKHVEEVAAKTRSP